MARILVVEDEDRFRRYLVRALSLEGHEVEGAADVQEAVSATRSRAPELLVVDWMLGPGEDGVQVAARLRRHFPGLRTLVITGHPTDELEKSLEQGTIHALLGKPFRPEVLFEAIRRLEEV